MHIQLNPAPRRIAGHLRFTSNVLRSLGVLNDVICFFVAFLLAQIFYDLTIGYYYDTQVHSSAAAILCLNYFLIRVSRDGYSTFLGHGSDLGGGAIAEFLLASALTSLVIIQLNMLGEFSRGVALFFIASSVVLLFVSRISFGMLASALMRRGYVGQRVAIYSENAKTAAKVVQLLEMERLPHLRLLGYADERQSPASPAEDVNYLGGFAALLEYARDGRLDQVILAVPHISQKRLDEVTETLSAAAIDICILPRETLELTSKYRVNFLGSLPVFAVWQQPIRDIDGVMKELLDF